MRILKLYLSLLAPLLFTQTLVAQQAPLDWGKVSEEERQMTVYPLDSSAAAVILCDFGTVEFDVKGNDFRTVFNHHRRIKILKESGFDQADVNIPYYEELENISKLKAEVILPDGKKLSVDKKDIFTEELSKNWSAKKFAFPGIVPGAIIEYQYTLTSERIFELREWYFEHDIPVVRSEFRTAVPEWYDYIVLNQGTAEVKKEYDRKNERFSIRVRNNSRPGVREVRVERSGLQQFNVLVNQVKYVLENAPGLRSERYITTMDDYRTRLRFQLQSVQFPNSQRENILSSWPKLAEELMKSATFGMQFQEKRFFKKVWKEVEPQLGQLGSQTEKVRFIYSFVVNNMNWNGSYSFSMQAPSINDCFAKKSGYSGELNLMVLALLQEAGIDAKPILISTRKNGKTIELYPLLDQFNHCIIYAKADDKQLLMDASNPNRPINYLRESALNSTGWLVDPQNPVWVNIVPEKGKLTFFSTFVLDDQGSLNGEMKMKFDGYNAISERDELTEHPGGEHWQNIFTKRYPDIEDIEIAYEGVEDINDPVTSTVKLEIPNMAMVSGDFIYLSPLVYTTFEENPFKLEKRTYPVDIPYPVSENNIINITIPEGYIIEELPAPANISLPERGGAFQYMISQKGNTVQLISRISINQLKFEPEAYSTIRNFFELIIEKQSEQIVLKKQT